MEDEGRAGRSYQNWPAVMEDLLHGTPAAQQLALLKLNRLTSGFLTKLRAWNHRDECYDLCQTVLEKLVKSYCRGQLREPKAFVAFAHTITRHEFFDFLRARPGTEVRDLPDREEPQATDEATVLSVRAALHGLPENLRKVVQAVYIEERTYEEAAQVTAIPLGSLKRYLRLGLAQLRKQLAGIVEAE